MSTAYWLAFALGSVPYLGYMVGMIMLGPVFDRISPGRSAGSGLPTWLLVPFSVFAFAFALSQQVGLGAFFDPLPFVEGDFREVSSRQVVGVDIPIEVGRAAESIFSSIFFLFLTWGLALRMIVAASRNKARGPSPLWVQYLIFISLVGALIWVGWPFVGFLLRDWHSLF